VESRTETLEREIAIAPLKRGDLPDALALQKMAFMTEALRYSDYRLAPLEESFRDFSQEFRLKTFFKAKLQGQMVGLIRGFVRDDTGSIERLSVHPAARGRGVGSALVRALEIALGCSRFTLFTGANSANNIRFYEALGYRRSGSQTHDSGVPLALMEKSYD
jgi:ribosomal protein S18 acetylase RimI-like enzyme